MDTPNVVLALSRGSVNFAFLTLLPTTAWDLIFIPSSFLHSKAVLEPPSRHPGPGCLHVLLVQQVLGLRGGEEGDTAAVTAVSLGRVPWGFSPFLFLQKIGREPWSRGQI